MRVLDAALADDALPRVVRPRVKNVELLRFRSLSTGASESRLPAAVRWNLFFSFLFAVALFYVFTYNSGYGYDALEYLVLGRAVAHGQPFYSLIPSKSPGIYYLISTVLSLGIPANHYTISALITLLFATSLMGTWFAVRHLLGYPTAIVSTLLVAACAAFMEMNFLEPESVVFLSGLAAYVLCLQSARTANLMPLFAAGLALAIGLHFKSVAAFYVVGVVCYLILDQLRKQHLAVRELLTRYAVLGVGVLVGWLPAVAFYATTGRLQEFWTWTITFPLLHYPSNTLWLDKLYTKLLWFHLLLIVAFSCSILVVRVRRSVWNTDGASLAFFMGLASYLALLKTQSSHYCFPGAAFFSIFMGAVLIASPKRKGVLNAPRWIAVAIPPVLIIVILSVVLYEPQVFSRFLQWRSFQTEDSLGAQVRQQVGPGSKGLFVKNGLLIHWVSGVEPAWRFAYFDAQTTFYLEGHPDALMNALTDKSTTIVEFNPDDLVSQDQGFIELEHQPRIFAEFTLELERHFRPSENSPAPFHFWVRKSY